MELGGQNQIIPSDLITLHVTTAQRTGEIYGAPLLTPTSLLIGGAPIISDLTVCKHINTP